MTGYQSRCVEMVDAVCTLPHALHHDVHDQSTQMKEEKIITGLTKIVWGYNRQIVNHITTCTEPMDA